MRNNIIGLAALAALGVGSFGVSYAISGYEAPNSPTPLDSNDNSVVVVQVNSPTPKPSMGVVVNFKTNSTPEPSPSPEQSSGGNTGGGGGGNPVVPSGNTHPSPKPISPAPSRSPIRLPIR